MNNYSCNCYPLSTTGCWTASRRTPHWQQLLGDASTYMQVALLWCVYSRMVGFLSATTCPSNSKTKLARRTTRWEGLAQAATRALLPPSHSGSTQSHCFANCRGGSIPSGAELLFDDSLNQNCYLYDFYLDMHMQVACGGIVVSSAGAFASGSAKSSGGIVNVNVAGLGG